MHGGKRRPQLGSNKRSAGAAGTLGYLGDGGTDDPYNQKRPQHVAGTTAMTAMTNPTGAGVRALPQIRRRHGCAASDAAAEGAHPEVGYTHQCNQYGDNGKIAK